MQKQNTVWSREGNAMPKKDPRLKELGEALKDLDIQEFSSYSEVFLSALRDGLVSLTDLRQQGKVKHLLSDCVGIILFCSFSDVDEWEEMEMFARDNEETLRKYLELPNGVPSHDTLERVLSIIKGEELQNLLVEVLKETIQRVTQDGYLYEDPELDIHIRDIVAIDGKETRKSGNPRKPWIEDQRNYDVLNVQSTETGITLSATRIDEKSNEIPEAQSVLQTLDLKGCIVTADAMNTQKKTADAIVHSANGDYCLAVKANQKQLYEDLVLYFSDSVLLKEVSEREHGFLREVEETNQRLITYEHYTTDDIGWMTDRKEWAKLKSIGYIRKTAKDKTTGKVTTEERYYICSIPAAAELFALTVRRHWHIENTLHWALDVVFREDALHTREKRALHNLGLINRFVLSILKILKPYYNNISYRYMRRKIGRNLEKELPVVFAVLKKLYEMDALV